MISTAIFAY